MDLRIIRCGSADTASVNRPTPKQMSRSQSESVSVKIATDEREVEEQIIKRLRKKWYPTRVRCTWSDLQPMSLAMMGFVFFLICMSLVAVKVYQNRVRNPETQILWDVTFSYVPHIDSVFWHELNVYGYVFVALFAVQGHVRRVVLNRRVFLLWMVAIILRTCTIADNAYPDPSDGCRGEDPLPNIWMSVLQFQSCGDLIFSGHTVAVLSSFFILIDCFPLSVDPGIIAGHVISAMVAISALFCILATRLHYTTDVVVAIIIYILMRILDYTLVDNYYVRRLACYRWWEKDRYAKCGVEGCEGWGHPERIPQWVVDDIRTTPEFAHLKRQLSIEMSRTHDVNKDSRPPSPASPTDTPPTFGAAKSPVVTVLGLHEYSSGTSPADPAYRAAADVTDSDEDDDENRERSSSVEKEEAMEAEL